MIDISLLTKYLSASVSMVPSETLNTMIVHFFFISATSICSNTNIWAVVHRGHFMGPAKTKIKRRAKEQNHQNSISLWLDRMTCIHKVVDLNPTSQLLISQ